jgi:polar amino acid transport system substrate-binding protein
MNDRKFWLKLVTVLAAVMMIMAACGEDEGLEEEPGAGSTEDAGGGDYTLIADGHLTVGSDIPYPPFEFEEGGKLAGFDIDLVRAVAEKLGLENTDDDWISTNFDTIFQQLASGTKFDIVVAAVTAYAPDGSPAAETVAERRQAVDFTVAYYPSLQSTTVDTTKTPDVASFEDLPDGARVAVQRATTGAFYAQQNLAPRLELVDFAQAPPMYQALLAGQVDAVFNDLPVSLDAIKDNDTLEVVEEVQTGEEYAFAVNKENPALLDAIDAALEELYSDGTYAEIFKKYFPEQPLPDYASE